MRLNALLNRKGFALDTYLRDTLLFLIIWLFINASLRAFSWLCANPMNMSLPLIFIGGVINDIIGFVIIWFFWSIVQRLFQTACCARYASIPIFIILIIIGIPNALFISWSHQPLDHTFFTYVRDIESFYSSALQLLPSAKTLIIFFIFFNLSILIPVLSSRVFEHPKKASGIHLRPLPWFIIGITAFTSLFLHLTTYTYKNDYAKAITANIVLHEFTTLINKPIKGKEHNIARRHAIHDYAVWSRQWLIHDQGDFDFLNDYFPLIKYNKCFSRPGKRNNLWDRHLVKKPNIVLLFLESFRAHDIGAYGSKKGLTPNFDELVKRSWLWTNFYASGIQTPRAALAALCSIYPYFGNSIQRSNPDLPLRGLPDILSENGYATEFYHNGKLAFDKKIPFFPNLGFKKTFGMKDLDPQGKFGNFGWGFPDVAFAELLANRLNEQKLNSPLFLTAFTVSHHHPWDVPDPSLKLISEADSKEYSRFQNSMHYSDYALGVFFNKIKKEALNKTIFFILADTAQPMGEHHNNFILIRYLYEENLRIPFLIYAPGFIKEEKKFPGVASQVDIMPTILDMLNIECLNHSVGRSLLSEMDHPFAFFSNPYFEGWAGIRMGKYKYIHQFKDNKDLLFDLAMDPLERKDLSPNMSQMTNKLKTITFNKVKASQGLINDQKIWNSKFDALVKSQFGTAK